MFQIVQGNPDPKQVWLPINMVTSASTMYYGQLCKMDSASFNGVAPLAAASGAFDTNSKERILGIVKGFNYYPLTELNDSTYGQYMTGVDTAAAQKAIQKMGNQGMFAAGDPNAMVQVELLNPHSVIEGNIWCTSLGTAPTLLTASGTPTTTAITLNAPGFTPVAQMCTVYCRTGANAGIYRISSNTSTTAWTFTTAWPATPASGDTFVAVPYRVGMSYGQINSTSGYLGLWLDGTASPATNYFGMMVLELDLRYAGMEKARFQFDPCHYTGR